MRSDGPPNSLVIKDKDTEEVERERKRDWGKTDGGREERSVAISFQTALVKCAEMTQAFRYGVCTRL